MKADEVSEEASFSISNYEVHHQGVNSLDIKLSWKQHAPYVTNQFLYQKIDSFFHTYPNTTDWWEIVNKNLTSLLMNTYPEMDSIASDIEVHWVSGAGVEYGHRYPTRCLTCRTRSGKLYQHFGFRTLKDFEICSDKGHCEAAYLDVLYTYVEPIANDEYPDGLAAENSFKSFLNDYAKDGLEKANKEAEKALLDKFPKVVEVISAIRIKEIKGVSEIYSDVKK